MLKFFEIIPFTLIIIYILRDKFKQKEKIVIIYLYPSNFDQIIYPITTDLLFKRIYRTILSQF